MEEFLAVSCLGLFFLFIIGIVVDIWASASNDLALRKTNKIRLQVATEDLEKRIAILNQSPEESAMQEVWND
jgi:hypothetical protein